MNIYLLCVLSVGIAFALTAILGKILIPLLRKLKFGQNIIADFGPTWHKDKQGVPTMGGLMFIISIVLTFGIAMVIAAASKIEIISSVSEIIKTSQLTKLIGCGFLALAFGFVGFIDDYIKVAKKRNLGLTEFQKTFMEILIIIGFIVSMNISGNVVTLIPGLGKVAVESFTAKTIHYIFTAIVIYATVNAANFTDGLDGLCSSVSLPMGLTFGVMAIMVSNQSVAILAFALSGALGAYLIYNHHPAKVIMGDTCSNFIGGLVAAFAFALDCPLILLPVAIVYVIEGASDVLQIASIKIRGKKIFKMAPIHHHFEMTGWSENKIVAIFSAISVIGCVIGLLTFNFIIK